MAPVCDLVLVPLGLAGEEVVVGHVGVAAAWLPHGLDGALVELPRLWQPEELLHLLQCVLQHKQVATLLGAAVEGVQILLEEMNTQGQQLGEDAILLTQAVWDPAVLGSLPGSQTHSVAHQLSDRKAVTQGTEWALTVCPI